MELTEKEILGELRVHLILLHRTHIYPETDKMIKATKYYLDEYANLKLREKAKELTKKMTEKAESWTGSMVRKEESDIYGDGYVDGLDTAIDLVNETLGNIETITCPKCKNKVSVCSDFDNWFFICNNHLSCGWESKHFDKGINPDKIKQNEV